MAAKREVRPGILDRPLTKPKGEVSLSSFAFLFSEIVQYSQNRVTSIGDLERKLEEMGYGVGQRVIELISCRDRVTKRETRLVNMLQYVSNVVWRHLFNKEADSLQRSMENEDEYMIHENNPVTNTFVSLPVDMGQLNCAAYLAGIIAGILDSAKFNAKVTAHLVHQPDGPDRTVFLIKFSPEVMAREKRMGAA
mmetsp:Transcript_11736/g.17779  ORF Transcript_11736/g.17779 Transcript_11736/m.17779 type:complete len:194 (+) Transcript_11736:75-656(+)|eukprot:CAMPEP_0185026892 /NCGR_PEP_ID=MMETSP1103-20130426/11464_1 /TAXON_ID=36769 /ORGANISM="Paraphysomonas bandaiensis, Strain Caron Lab Isolate" /LENGTH=193 /DNA_ID=CAMNT_0027560639 /DNA_START=26 /DNA_END=607 /DNA_ORIENTATION=+